MTLSGLSRRLSRVVGRIRAGLRSLSIPPDSYPVLKEVFLVTRSGDRQYLTLAPSGHRFIVNASSAATLGLCNGGRTVAQIASLLARELGIEPDQMAQDVRRLVARFVRAGILQLHRGSNPPPFIALPHGTVTSSEVEAEVRFRMGRFFDNPLPLTESLAEAHRRRHALFEFRNGELARTVGLEPGGRGRVHLFQAALMKLDRPRADFSILFAGGDGADSHAEVPIHGHFRVVGSDATILCPLKGYSTIDAGNFGRDIDQYDILWERKIDKAVWRGATTGFVIKNLDPEAIETLIRAPRKANNPITGEVLPKGNRLQLVENYRLDERCDVGLSTFAQIDEAGKAYLQGKGYCKPSLDKKALLRHKYLIAIDGNTFSTQLPWSLHSRSVVLMVPPAWEVIVWGVIPWEHYVPLAADFSDLGDKIEWCRANDGRCREIANAATQLMRRFYDASLEHAVQQRLIERYVENFRAR